MYPSNGFVQVIVYGGGDSFRVSDNAGAINELVSAGIDVHRSDGSIARKLKEQGLQVSHAAIVSQVCTRNELPIAIALVANASKDIAEWLFDTARIRPQRDFKALVRAFLDRTFESRAQKDVTIVGGSNKPHRFDNIVITPNGGRLIVDPVIHDHSSISARIVANMDVRNADIPNLEQRIIYDDEDDWNAADLNLLQVGAPVIAFSKSVAVITRLVGAQQ